MRAPDKTMSLGEKFEQALIYAVRLHAGQQRKGSSVPYVSHLLGVAGLVIEDGGGEEEAIAGLLHDAVEDQGGLATLSEIRRRFGSEVASIVAGCSDSFEVPKPPWKQRKTDYLARLTAASPAVCRVSLADKLHNARAICRDFRLLGEGLWGRFAGGRDGTLWYYDSLARVFQQRSDSSLLPEFMEVVEEMQRLAAGLPGHKS